MADVWAAITTTENILRDLIETLLRVKHGDDWLAHSGLSEDRIEKLHEGLAEERKRRDGGRVNERLIYYAQIWDLQTILAKNWDAFEDCFGDRRVMELNMKRLGGFRNPEMHGRGLLPFEEHLVLGITGEIRNKVTLFMSTSGGEPEHFPRVESAVDSFGNAARPLNDQGLRWEAMTDLILRPGDEVTFRLSAWDPGGEPHTWRVISPSPDGGGIELDGDEATWHVGDEHICDPGSVYFYLVGSRPYHRLGGGTRGYDDTVVFQYRVLPAS